MRFEPATLVFYCTDSTDLMGLLIYLNGYKVHSEFEGAMNGASVYVQKEENLKSYRWSRWSLLSGAKFCDVVWNIAALPL